MDCKLKISLLLLLILSLSPISGVAQDGDQDPDIPLMETPEDIYERLREELGIDIEFEQFLELLEFGLDENGIIGLLVNFNSIDDTIDIYFSEYIEFFLEGNSHEDILQIIGTGDIPFDPLEQLNELLNTDAQESLDELLAISDSILDVASILEDIDLDNIEDIIENGKNLPIPQEVWDEFTKVYFDVTQIKQLLPTDGKINGPEDLGMITAFFGVSKGLKDLQLAVLVGLFPEYEDDIIQHIKIAFRNRMERLTNPYLRWVEGDRNGTPNDSVHEIILTLIIDSL